MNGGGADLVRQTEGPLDSPLSAVARRQAQLQHLDLLGLVVVSIPGLAQIVNARQDTLDKLSSLVQRVSQGVFQEFTEAEEGDNMDTVEGQRAMFIISLAPKMAAFHKAATSGNAKGTNHKLAEDGTVHIELSALVRWWKREQRNKAAHAGVAAAAPQPGTEQGVTTTAAATAPQPEAGQAGGDAKDDDVDLCFNAEDVKTVRQDHGLLIML